MIRTVQIAGPPDGGDLLNGLPVAPFLCRGQSHVKVGQVLWRGNCEDSKRSRLEVDLVELVNLSQCLVDLIQHWQPLFKHFHLGVDG